jgi:hypothetical protein
VTFLKWIYRIEILTPDPTSLHLKRTRHDGTEMLLVFTETNTRETLEFQESLFVTLGDRRGGRFRLVLFERHELSALFGVITHYEDECDYDDNQHEFVHYKYAREKVNAGFL